MIRRCAKCDLCCAEPLYVAGKPYCSIQCTCSVRIRPKRRERTFRKVDLPLLDDRSGKATIWLLTVHLLAIGLLLIGLLLIGLVLVPVLQVPRFFLCHLSGLLLVHGFNT